MKSTIIASADVALIKYWGKKDGRLRIPENNSVSMVLNGLYTTTTVEFQKGLKKDEITIQEINDQHSLNRVVELLDRVRRRARISTFAKVVSTNNFPSSTGLSSSASGFAALVIAAARAAGLQLPERELSIFARISSGSACRCVYGGFVEWKKGDTSDTSYSKTIFPASHWDIRDVIVVVNEDKKPTSSTKGHKNARTSPFFRTRLENINGKIQSLKKFIKDKDFKAFGELVESEALEFHSILLTSNPPLVAWHPGTIQVMREVRKLRNEGIMCYFTINTGFNVHVLTLPEFEEKVRKRFNSLSLVKKTIVTKIGSGPIEINKHLF